MRQGNDDGSRGADGSGRGRRRSGELSGLILGVLRAAGGELTPGEVCERLGAAGAPELAYTTVVTILSRLRSQGLLERRRVGRAYAYRAVADPARLAAGRMRRVLDAEHDRDAVLASFVRELSADDERLLRELLDTDLTGDGDVPGERPR
ncbi:BlaI/MecI/CopY family transcriptional regulator [Nocardia sp. BMG111209]|uniref:BlaI/MecI/CopY family transcriptional regulator n=1 Tax=Nocardia sp. BMG111209 TaxID=1160137 RepID=UPI00035F45F9|nr:BlaI/MecI/CopY family transcriptional regulator [Nocardia sp. BMG111209]